VPGMCAPYIRITQHQAAKGRGSLKHRDPNTRGTSFDGLKIHSALTRFKLAFESMQDLNPKYQRRGNRKSRTVFNSYLNPDFLLKVC
jgi:hypothetical protein